MPIAKPDTARTPRGVPVVIAVLSNDQGGSLTVVGYTLPTAGTLVLNPDQTFTYTPTADGKFDAKLEVQYGKDWQLMTSAKYSRK